MTLRPIPIGPVASFQREPKSGKYKGHDHSQDDRLGVAMLLWTDPHEHEHPSDANQCACDALDALKGNNGD